MTVFRAVTFRREVVLLPTIRPLQFQKICYFQHHPAISHPKRQEEGNIGLRTVEA